MSQLAYNPVVLAEMTRAVHADRPDADWHELEPVLRAQWEQMPRAIAWDTAREAAAAHFRSMRGLPDAAPVVGLEQLTSQGTAS
ncbi:hypothetical protein LU699_15245 [Luteimonas fraxinea]|uniref:Uncharacterized protein n=1 Tax=Luteimonas fraxinea TaxID=2901869 RepID=A0ABS8UE51_9GAMM|nr:hypothetical protein [Luteimonas fraxinea]MCD9097021.1 hypothetical protein [Luteimonas fraxinea]MCD9126642.1 hypothetical protein [Luteimonas fraxinea]UHH09606.1 hypothetical protein LU699_15245 [Luteimonas fraxinea]